jgi:hypothetical protein
VICHSASRVVKSVLEVSVRPPCRWTFSVKTGLKPGGADGWDARLNWAGIQLVL